jgi:type I restriction enzyme S subunit
MSLCTEKTDRRCNPVALENIEGCSGRFIATGSEFEGEGVAFKSGDLLFGKLRPYLAKVYLAEAAGEAVGDFHVLRPADSLDGRYAQYQILNHSFIEVVDGSTFGSKMPRASWESLGGMPFAIPPHTEQIEIAAFLDRETAKIDTLITEQEKLIALLAEKHRATISYTVTRGLNPDAPMKNPFGAWLNEVPAHWAVERMRFLIRESISGPYGSSLTKDMYVASGYRVYGQQQVIPNDFCIGDYYISHEKFDEMSRYRVLPDDVLISVMGTIGRAAVVPADVEPGIINPRLVLYRVREQQISPRYLQAFLNSPTSQEYFSLVALGTTMQGLNMTLIGELEIAVPPLNEQEQISAFIDGESGRIGALRSAVERAIALLKERRSALITSAVTGQVDVRSAMRQPTHPGQDAADRAHAPHRLSCEAQGAA